MKKILVWLLFSFIYSLLMIGTKTGSYAVEFILPADNPFSSFPINRQWNSDTDMTGFQVDFIRRSISGKLTMPDGFSLFPYSNNALKYDSIFAFNTRLAFQTYRNTPFVLPFAATFNVPVLSGDAELMSFTNFGFDTDNLTHDQRLMITERDEERRELREELADRDKEYRAEREALYERDLLKQEEIRANMKESFLADFNQIVDQIKGYQSVLDPAIDLGLEKMLQNMESGSDIVQEMKDIFQEENTFVLVEYVEIPVSTNTNDTNVVKTVAAVTNKVALTEEEHEIIEDDFLVFDTLELLLAEKTTAKKTNKTESQTTNTSGTNATNLTVAATEDEDEDEDEETDSLTALKELIRQTKGFGYLSINIARKRNEYRLFLNGKYMDTLDYNNNYESEMIGGETYDIVLIENDSSKQVYQEVVTIERDKTNRIDYIPTGNLDLTIKYLKTPSFIKVDGSITDVTTNTTESFHSIPLEAYDSYKIDIVTTNDGLLLTRKIVDIDEAETTKLRMRLGSKNRRLFFWLKGGLEGGPSAQFGLDFKLHERHRFDIYAGAIFTDPVVLRGNIEYTWFFLVPKDSIFRLGLNINTTHLYTFSGNNIYSFSPGGGLVVGLGKFYLFLKGRYSLDDESGGLYPEISLGFLF